MISLEVHAKNGSGPSPVLFCVSGHSPPTRELKELVSDGTLLLNATVLGGRDLSEAIWLLRGTEPLSGTGSVKQEEQAVTK